MGARVSLTTVACPDPPAATQGNIPVTGGDQSPVEDRDDMENRLALEVTGKVERKDWRGARNSGAATPEEGSHEAALMNSPAQADSAGSYYPTPSWDQTLPASTRFTVLSNFAGAAVLDRNTGLVWEKSPSNDARFYCANGRVGGPWIHIGRNRRTATAGESPRLYGDPYYGCS